MKSPKRVHPTKLKLLHAAAELLDSTDPDNLSQDQVLEASGVSKGSMYHHFEDFSDVVESAVIFRFHRNVDDHIGIFQTILNTAQNREEFMVRMVELTRISQDRQRFPFRFERARALGFAGGSPRFKQKLGLEQQRMTDAFTDLFSRAQLRMWIRPDLDPRAIGVFVQAYTLGKVVDDIVPYPMQDEAWIALIEQFLRSTAFRSDQRVATGA
jgi:AcrR family transcriptional regulator